MVTKKQRLSGGGPWQFTPPELQVGDKHLFDFDRREKGRFKKWLPFDIVRFVNNQSNSVTATINGIYTTEITGNTIVVWDKVGVRDVRIENTGGGVINTGSFVVETQKSPYGADEKARESVSKPWLSRALDDVIPGGLPGGK